MKINKFIPIVATIFMMSTNVLAEGWCNLKSGFTVVTHGTKTNNVYILGEIEGRSGGLWITIADDNVGKNNISLALAAQMASKTLSIYLDSADDNCDTFPSWAPVGKIRHVRIL